jgi:hypothetical protein
VRTGRIIADEKFYETAAQEVSSKQIMRGLMAKAFSECDGDEKRTIARYTNTV